MKILWTMMAAMALTAGAALAQTAPTVIVLPATATPVLVPANPATATVACPLGYPAPCAARLAPDISGDSTILVLGSEEHYALHQLNARGVNVRDVAGNYSSIFDPTNPLTSHQPNTAITRGGNPNFPYYVAADNFRVAGTEERYNFNYRSSIHFPSSVINADRVTLSNVYDRYHDMTPGQAKALGYQPLNACIDHVGMVYINQALIDNQFDPMTPEAFSFDNDGNLLAAHYLLLADQPFTAFGQRFMASPIVPGAQQLPVWLFTRNSRGLFTLTAHPHYCAPAGTLR